MQNYRPKADEIPQPFSIRMLREYLSSYKKQKKKAALLHGPTGTGKTSSVYALADELGLDVIEVNSSDFRNSKEIEARIGQAASQQTLFTKGRIILVDEIDGIAGNEDRGGMQALAKVIDKTGFPIIMTANNPWDSKFSTLRQKSMMIDYPSIPANTIQAVLLKHCQKQNLQHDIEGVSELAKKSRGDIRAAIQDLHSLKEVTKTSVRKLYNRNKEASMSQAIQALMATGAKEAFDATTENEDEWSLWIDENMPRHYNAKEKAQAYEYLSKADVYKGRIRKQQYWRLLAYIREFLIHGVETAKEASKGYIKPQQPQRLLATWIANAKNARKKAIIQKLAKHMHCSTKKAMKESGVLLHILKQKKNSEKAVRELKLEQEEIEWLQKV